jgi:preprotein translocase subunit SecD
MISRIIEEAMDIVVGGEVVCSPVVREVLGIREMFSISACNIAQAQDIVAKLRKGWVIPGLRVVE